VPADPQWRFASFRLDSAAACLWQHDRLLPLPPKPFAVLAHLVAHAGQVVTKEALLDAVWPEAAVSEGVLKTCMGQIRQALGDTARTPHYIETVHRRGYRFIAPVTRAAPAPHAAVSPDSPPCLASPPLFVARDAEMQQLRQAWLQALQGTRQMVFITGEAGIGKTSLIDAFVPHLGSPDGVWSGRGQCIEHYGAGEAYLPLLEALGQVGRGPDGARVVELLHQQAPSWLLQMPALLPGAAYEALQRRSSGMTRERMLRELAEALEILTTERPVVLIVEDLHWSDHATLDWLTFVAHRRQQARLLILGTYRPAEAALRNHPVRRMSQELQRHGQCTELYLPYLPDAAIATYLGQRFEAATFPLEMIHILHQRTNGNPFFLVTVVEELVQQGLIGMQSDGWTLRGDLEAVAACIPDSIWHLIEHQLAQTSPLAQDILAAASTAGTEFVAAVVSASLDQAPEDVEACCEALVRSGQFLQSRGVTTWPDGTVTARYRFMHDLYGEVLYARVPVSRRVQWHRRIGVRLEAGYGATARELAPELASHFGRGRDVPRTVQYLQYAGEQALQRNAYQEALTHLTTGLTQLQQLPESPERTQQELALQCALGAALRATTAYTAETEQAYLRARELCQQLQEPPQLFPILYSLYELYEFRGAFPRARELGEQLLDLADHRHDVPLLLGAHEALACPAFHLGAFDQVLDSTERALDLYQPQHHQALVSLYGKDLGVSSRYWSAMALWFLGYPDRARARIEEALALAQELSHAYSLAVALDRAAFLGQFRRDLPATSQWADAMRALAAEHGFRRQAALSSLLSGWVLAMQGHGEEGMAQIRQGLAAYRKLGMAMEDPYFLALLAEASASAGRVQDGKAVLAEALALIPSGRGFFYEAELYRLQGELCLSQSASEEQRAEGSFCRALEIARRQAAKALELRAATSLSRLWQSQDKRQEAHDLLAPVYEWFTEGFDTADLQEAKRVLDDL
jgi:DNA-binding winged helix-turn-helix (wHTH) protein/predicted ATPase